MLWFTRHGKTLHILRDEYVFQMPVHFGESYFLLFAFDCQGKKVGKNTEVVSVSPELWVRRQVLSQFFKNNLN